MKKLEWNVYRENFNSRKIEIYNIFNHYYFNEDLIELYNKYKNDKETFFKELEFIIRYYYWSKCEWEIILSAWPPNKKFNDEKISVYDQLALNWNSFLDYVWNNRELIKELNTEVKYERS